MQKIEKNFIKFFSKYEIWNFDEITRFSLENIKEYEFFYKIHELEVVNDDIDNDKIIDRNNEKSAGTGSIFMNLFNLF